MVKNKKEINQVSQTIVVLTFVVIAIAIVNLSVSLMKVADMNEKISGYAAGYVNLTIQTVIAINVSNQITQWGVGVVNTTADQGICNIPANQVNATLTTQGDADGVVVCGNWSGLYGNLNSAKALIVQNLGTVNASLYLVSNKNDTELIGGDETINAFQWNITDKQANSCQFNTTFGGNGVFVDVNESGSNDPQGICTNFSFDSNAREIYIDTKIVVPYNAPSSPGGESLATFTITAQPSE